MVTAAICVHVSCHAGFFSSLPPSLRRWGARLLRAKVMEKKSRRRRRNNTAEKKKDVEEGASPHSLSSPALSRPTRRRSLIVYLLHEYRNDPGSLLSRLGGDKHK